MSDKIKIVHGIKIETKWDVLFEELFESENYKDILERHLTKQQFEKFYNKINDDSYRYYFKKLHPYMSHVELIEKYAYLIMSLDEELYRLTNKKLKVANDYIEFDGSSYGFLITKKEYDTKSGKFQLFSGKHYCMPFLDESQTRKS
jgi:hypothetical protein